MEREGLSRARVVIPFPKDVGVSIVCHNNRDKLAATMASLDAAGCPRSAVLVVDVASTDGTVDWLRQTYSGITIRTLDRNDGPSPGRNVGIRESPFPYVFLMDADVQVQPETIQQLRAAMAEDPRDQDRQPHRRARQRARHDSVRRRQPALHLRSHQSLARSTARRARRRVRATLVWPRRAACCSSAKPRSRSASSTSATSSARKTATSRTASRLAGYRILELPSALVVHQSRPRGTWLFYYQIRNRWHFMLKNYQGRRCC